jgi:predicted HicB family RNase H-like nuclease
MKNMICYKEYFGSVHYSDDDRVLYGKLEYIKSLVNYEGTDVAGLRQAFHEAVDDYLALCTEEGLEPERPFKGSFNVRTGWDAAFKDMNKQGDDELFIDDSIATAWDNEE